MNFYGEGAKKHPLAHLLRTKAPAASGGNLLGLSAHGPDMDVLNRRLESSSPQRRRHVTPLPWKPHPAE